MALLHKGITMEDLIQRLRFALRDWDGKDRFHFPSINALSISEAADLIQSQQSRIKELEGALAGVIASWDNNNHEREKFVAEPRHPDIPPYWSPHSAMVNSEAIHIARTTLGDKSPIHPVKTRGTE